MEQALANVSINYITGKDFLMYLRDERHTCREGVIKQNDIGIVV